MVDRKQLSGKTIILPLLVLFSFILRSVSLFAISTGGRFLFTGTDSFYHMRRVLYTTQNFPSTLTFDSYLNYPSGFDIGWPPLYDHAIAVLALILGLGSPDVSTIEFAGAIFPALVGALTIVPLYYASSAVFDKRTAIFSAIILSLIPIHLSVSIAGATDHHVAEIFLATSAYALYLYSLKYGRVADLSVSDIRESGIRSLVSSQAATRSLLYSAACGFVLAVAVFTWLGSPIFIGMIGLFVFAQLVVDLKEQRHSEYILINSVTVFLTTLLLIIPFISLVVRPGMEFSGMFLSWFHVLYIASLLIGTVVLGLVAGIVASRKLSWYYYPAIILALSGIGIVVINYMAPQFYQNTIGGILYLLGGSTDVLGTISEASPFFYNTSNSFTLQPLWRTLFIFSITAFFGLLLGGLKFKREKYMPEMMFFMIWSIVVIVLTISQRRFSYLLSLNVAMLSGFFFNAVYTNFLGNRVKNEAKKAVPGKKISGSKSKSKSKKGSARSGKASSGMKDAPVNMISGGTSTPYLSAILVVMLAFVLFTPVYSLITHPGVPSTDWQESLEWLGSNSPETSYYSDPSVEPEYGVMSWWDYGNWILYIAKRPVVANNFQTGIEDSARFFASTNESESLSILDRDNAKYVVTDQLMYATKSYVIFAIAGEEYMNGQDFDTFYKSQDMRRTTLAKLHILDGSHLGRLRLIHESPNSQMGLSFGENEETTPIKNVKVFEYVPGAKIYGSAEPNQPVYARVTVTSNQGRQFIYENIATADDSGYYEMRVPYSTSGSDSEFTTDPNYVVFLENVTISQDVVVSEEDVTQGNEIQVNLL